MDIATAVMTMLSFQAALRIGHLERIKHIIGYVPKMHHVAIRMWMAELDLSSYTMPNYDWMNTIYGDCQEEVP
jgi:hypothetical protein